MSAIAIDVSPAIAVHPGSVEARQPGSTAEVSAQLVCYWRDQLRRPLRIRRAELDEICRGVRSGSLPASTLVPYALGDNDEEIVIRAALAYAGACRAQRPSSLSAVTDAVEWIRRRLALNRAAVFAALLSLDDEDVRERLLPLRQELDADELAVVLRRHRHEQAQPKGTQAFLRAWQDLLATATTADGRSMRTALGAPISSSRGNAPGSVPSP